MGTTTFKVVVNGVDYSNYIMGADVWAEDKLYVMHADIFLDNAGNRFGGEFNSGDSVALYADEGIGDVQIFAGLVDDARMDVVDWSVDGTVFHITARQRPNLAQLYHTGAYPSTAHSKWDDVLQHVLDDAQSGLGASEKLTYTSPSAGVDLEIKFNRSFLLDKFRDTLNRAGYNGYQHIDQSLHIFEEGAAGEHIAYTLKSVTDATNNTILDFKETEQLGKDIKNYLEYFAGTVKDHWTEPECLDDWTAGTQTTIGYDTDRKVGFNRGSFFMTRTDPPPIGLNPDISFEMYLAFPVYNYVYLDMSEPAENYVWVYWDNQRPVPASNVVVHFRPNLMDQHGNIAERFEYPREMLYQEQGVTEARTKEQWWQVKFQSGADQAVEEALAANGSGWQYKVKPRVRAGIEYLSASMYNVSGRGTILITPTGSNNNFSNFAVGGSLIVEDSATGNDGTYTVYSITSSNLITLTTAFPSSGVTETAATFIAPVFDWSHITRIGVRAIPEDPNYTSGPLVPNCDVYVDFMGLPGVECISIGESVASSVLYGKKMHPEHHPEVASQTELDAILADDLEKQKWPLQGADAVVVGSTSFRYAGPTISVYAPPYGIDPTEAYRVRKLHHVIRVQGCPGHESEVWVTETELLKHTVGGSSQQVHPRRLRLDDSPTTEAIYMLRDLVHRISMESIPASMSATYVRVPNPGEVGASVTFDVLANRPSTSTLNYMYYATDTQVWYWWSGVAWVEITRAEARIRLAQLTERDHDSITDVDNDDHHNQHHGSSHSTASGDDSLDTSSQGAHSHGFTYSGYKLPSSFDTLYAAGSSGGSPIIPFYAIKTYSDQNVLQAISSNGSHVHNVTTSPSEAIEEDENNPMIEILEDVIRDDGMRVLQVNFKDFDLIENMAFPAERSDGNIFKNIKQRWHDIKDFKDNEPEIKKKKRSLKGKKFRWDNVTEKQKMLEKLADDGRSGWRASIERALKRGIAKESDVKKYEDSKKAIDEKIKKLKSSQATQGGEESHDKPDKKRSQAEA